MLLLPDLDLVFDSDTSKSPLENIIKNSFSDFDMEKIK